MCSIPNFSFKNPLTLSLSAHWCIWLMLRSPHMLPSTTMLIALEMLQKYPLYSRCVSTSSKYSTKFFFIFPILSLLLRFCKIDFRGYLKIMLAITRLYVIIENNIQFEIEPEYGSGNPVYRSDPIHGADRK